MVLPKDDVNRFYVLDVDNSFEVEGDKAKDGLSSVVVNFQAGRIQSYKSLII